MAERLNATARDVEADLAWLAALLQHRLDTYFAEKPASPALPGDRPPPRLADSPSPYAEFLRRHALTDDERAVLLLALAPSLRPQLLDVLWARNPANQRGYSEFGGVQGAASGHFIPTGETACFLLAGDHLPERLRVIHRLGERDSLLAGDVLLPLAPPPGEGLLAGRLQPAPALLALFGLDAPGSEADALPAQRVTTGLAWADLVLPPATLAQLEEVRDWLAHGDTLLHTLGMAARMRPGYTCLFYGPPGTGKTLSACLLGKLCEREVHRVDLSMVVSKYIGETEKNLARVFDLAEQRGWILFFDEADALFGQRTRVDSAHDRYANQEVSYLLQRIEDFPGVVILSSNLRGNIDDAFTRRFQSVVAFPMPAVEERYRLWTESIPALLERDRDLDFVRLAEKYEVSGGTIINVIRYAALRSLVRGDRRLATDDIDDGLRRELLKEGRGF
ncbi:MAG: ATPase, central region [Proteobacteria bacterium]|nr:ATPase, central region [Pseudomonadota bacterium]